MPRAGERAVAARLLPEREPFPGELTLELAGVLALLGREGEALDVIERAADQGFRDVVLVLVHPDIERLKGTRRFDTLLARMRRRG